MGRPGSKTAPRSEDAQPMGRNEGRSRGSGARPGPARLGVQRSGPVLPDVRVGGHNLDPQHRKVDRMRVATYTSDMPMVRIARICRSCARKCALSTHPTGYRSNLYLQTRNLDKIPTSGRVNWSHVYLRPRTPAWSGTKAAGAAARRSIPCAMFLHCHLIQLAPSESWPSDRGPPTCGRASPGRQGVGLRSGAGRQSGP